MLQRLSLRKESCWIGKKSWLQTSWDLCLHGAVNSAADYGAACTLQAASTAELRKVATKVRKPAVRQRRSMEGPSRLSEHDHLLRRNSFDVRLSLPLLPFCEKQRLWWHVHACFDDAHWFCPCSRCLKQHHCYACIVSILFAKLAHDHLAQLQQSCRTDIPLMLLFKEQLHLKGYLYCTRCYCDGHLLICLHHIWH